MFGTGENLGFCTAQLTVQYRPTHITVNEANATGVNARIALVYVPNLSDVIADTTPINGGELMLLRPRRGDGTLTQCNSLTSGATNYASNTYFESFADGTPNLADFVPIDSFDFSGLSQVGSGTNVPAPSWYYARPNPGIAGVAQYAWQFVYPGLYDVTKGTTNTTPRQEATYAELPFENLTADNMPAIIIGAGGAGNYALSNAVGNAPPAFPGIQLQNVNWGNNSTYNRRPALSGSTISPIGFPAAYNVGGKILLPLRRICAMATC